MLEKLKFEAQTRSTHPKIRRLDLYDRSPPNVGSDQRLSLSDIDSMNHVVALYVHGLLLAYSISQSVLAVTLHG
jgi:hypothetical protein